MISRVNSGKGWLLAIAALASMPSAAFAGGVKRECVDAYEHAQLLRRDGKLRAAREQLLVCVQDRCPELARQDCVKWLREVEDTTPSIIVRARGGAGDLADVRVTFDGAPLLERLDGRPVAVDPGEHTLRFEHPGEPLTERKVVIAAGEKNRVVEVTFSSGSPAAVPTVPTAPPIKDAAPSTSGPAPGGPSVVPVATIILGSLGLVATGLSTYFEIKGLGDRQHLFQTCDGHCQQADVDAAYRELRVGDVAGAVALASLGGALWVFLARPSAESSTGIAVGVHPLPGGVGFFAQHLF
jgi:hypothetical protein